MVHGGERGNIISAHRDMFAVYSCSMHYSNGVSGDGHQWKGLYILHLYRNVPLANVDWVKAASERQRDSRRFDQRYVQVHT